MKNNWQTKKLGEIAECKDGDWILSKYMQGNKDVRLIQLADIGDGEFLDKSSKYISFEKFKELKCTLLKPGDILLARLGDPIGKSCIFPDLGYKAITAVDCTIIRSKKEGILQKFLFYLINSWVFRKQISEYTTGTTRKRISRKNLEKLSVIVPPTGIQHKIVKRLDAIRDYQDSLKKQKEKLSELFESTLNKAMKGELVS